QPLDDDVHAAVGHFGHLADRADRADRPKRGRFGILLVGVLQRKEEQPVARERAVHRVDGERPVHRQRLQRQREDDGLPEWKDRKLARIRSIQVGRHADSMMRTWRSTNATSSTTATKRARTSWRAPDAGASTSTRCGGSSGRRKIASRTAPTN